MEETTKSMYRVVIELEWDSPENNIGEEIVAYCISMYDAEILFNSRCERAARELAIFKKRGGYKTKVVRVYDESGQSLLRSYF